MDIRIKPLEWTKLSTGWISHTSFHAYEVVATANGFMATYANSDFAWGAEDAMKLAAQADFEHRILSALEPAAPEGAKEELQLRVRLAVVAKYAEIDCPPLALHILNQFADAALKAAMEAGRHD